MKVSLDKLVSLWRITLLAILTVVINNIYPIGSPTVLLIASVVSGAVIGRRLAFSKLKALGFVLFTAAFLALLFGFFSFTDYFASFSASTASTNAIFIEHLGNASVFLSLGVISSWLFWRFSWFATVELFFVLAGFLAVMSGHRDLNFDRPRIINTLAWQSNLEPIFIILLFGVLAAVTAIAYSALASQAVRKNQKISVSRGRVNIFASFCVVIILAAMISSIAGLLYQKKPTVNNGVGEKELSFPAGAGRSSQPAAIVRLEGDYQVNPWSPMLYLRESAFSLLSGNKLAFVGKEFDNDVPDISPKQSFSREPDLELETRTPLSHSVYMLVSQENAIAIDYPLSIVQLSNPNPDKFKATYRAYSVAPITPVSALLDSKAGDARWAPEVLTHYLRKHPDSRYQELAEKITEGITSPIRKAAAITNYLSQESTYTLTPNHQTPEGADETAAYLFGDKRGFCIHFAHATAFMLRGLGIPARIASGYLTDLSQSKDGHILLRISDRHAWAEVYIANHGWVPFDTQPEKVENHADTKVDVNLLDELMGMLDPGEEILPKEPEQKNSLEEAVKNIELPSTGTFLSYLAFLLAFLAVIKSYLYYGYTIPGSESTALKRLYNAYAARCRDLGYPRNYAETRLEYQSRIRTELDLDFKQLTERLLQTRYGLKSNSSRDLQPQSSGNFSALNKIALWRRILSYLSLSSVSVFLRGGRW